MSILSSEDYKGVIFNFKDDNITIYGRIALPKVTRSTFRGVYIYVNGRVVRDRVVRHALMEGYAQRLMKSCASGYVVFVMKPTLSTLTNKPASSL